MFNHIPLTKNASLLLFIILVRLKFFVLLIRNESEVAQSCPKLCDPVDCSLLGSSVRGVLRARILEWVAISFSRESFWATREALIRSKANLFITYILIYNRNKNTCIEAACSNIHIFSCTQTRKFGICCALLRDSQIAQRVKNLLANAGDSRDWV